MKEKVTEDFLIKNGFKLIDGKRVKHFGNNYAMVSDFRAEIFCYHTGLTASLELADTRSMELSIEALHQLSNIAGCDWEDIAEEDIEESNYTANGYIKYPSRKWF